MSKTEPNQAAFAYFNEMNSWQTGLTKREYFAAIVMQGIVTPGIPKELYARFAKDAIQLADALIKELNEGGNKALSPIELPTDEDIEDVSWKKFITDSGRFGFIAGAKWMRYKIKGV